MKAKKLINVLSILLIMITAIFILTSCDNNGTINYIYLRESFSINPYIIIYKNLNEVKMKQLESKCNDILYELDNKYNVNLSTSLISKINNEADKQEIEIDEEFYNLIKEAKYIHENVSSGFDITVYPLIEVWDFKNKYYINNNYEEIPKDEEINAKLDLVNSNYIILSEKLIDDASDELKEEEKKTYSVKFQKEGVKIDLGSLVKGLATDYIVNVMKDYGLNFGIVNVGGNVYVYGNKQYNVGITTPFHELLDENQNIIGYISTDGNDYSLVTSGIYERYIKTIDEKMYHHILNPFTGYPVNNDIVSITVIVNNKIYKNNSLYADALSTSLFTLGAKDAIMYASHNEGIEAVVITNDNKILLSSGIGMTEDDNLQFVFNENLKSLGYSVGN